MTWIAARLKEPSTWYGLGVVVAGLGAHFAPSEWTSFFAGVLYILGAGAVVTPDKKV